MGYRPAGEVDALRGQDPIPRYRARLLANGFTEADLLRTEDLARSEVDAAFEFARSAAYPEPQEAFDHVFG